MINDNLIRNLGDQLGRFINDAAAREDMHKSLNTIVQNVFARLDLVTREQFDAQLETVERLRGQLERLEAEVERLQQELGERDGQCAIDRADLAIESQLADELEALQVCREDLLGVRGEDTERDREVIAAAVLGQVGRRQVDRQAPGRGKAKAGIGDGPVHAIAALAHRGFGQTDDREARHAVGEIDLDHHRWCGDADLGAGVNDGE